MSFFMTFIAQIAPCVRDFISKEGMTDDASHASFSCGQIEVPSGIH
jgi:hypothetical protein